MIEEKNYKLMDKQIIIQSLTQDVIFLLEMVSELVSYSAKSVFSITWYLTYVFVFAILGDIPS